MGIKGEQWDIAQTLFEGARQCQPHERAAYLEQACPDDPDLRTDVLTMLALSEGDPDFLETSVLVQLATAPLLIAGEVVAERFRIVRHVGSGGMSEVYEAEDLVHAERPERVALKILRPALAAIGELVNRIHGEVQLAHRITHPNVCKIHSLHVDRRPAGDRLFLIMDFLDGESLRDRLQRDGPLEESFAFSIAEQIAAGVDEAHREGVIHKDLKSSNVMLVPRRDGTVRPVITDFGIAASEEDAFKRGTGTDAYMAPERLIDAGATRAADIYSFGVLLYEMVVGRLPFDPGTPVDRRQTSPPPPSTVRRELGRKWDRVILRCLHPSAAARFSHATQAVNALRRSRRWMIPAAAVAAALLIWALVDPIWHSLRGRTTTSSATLAILPFDIVGRGGQQGGLIDSLSEQLQKNSFIRRKWLVFSPYDARQMGVTSAEVAQRVFGAKYVLAGTVTADNTSVTVAGQLLEVGRARFVRSFQKTCALDNDVCLQTGLLQAMAGVLGAESSSVAQAEPISKAALPYYVQGEEYLRRDSVSYDIAIKFLQQAMALDPAAVMPRLALADAYMLRYARTGDEDVLDAARTILQEALAMHADVPDLHASFGNLYKAEGSYQNAARELQIAVQADPSNPFFLRAIGEVYDAAKQDADAAATFDKVIALQPRYWGGYSSYAAFHYRRGRYEEAAKLWEQLIEWTPDHAQALTNLGAAYIALSRNLDAENVSRRACALKADRVCYQNLGMALQRQRRTNEALTAYDRALTFGSPSPALLLNVADAYAYRGDRTEALDYFRRAASLAEERVTRNLENSADRARLAYCLVQLGELKRATFEVQQALQHSPEDKDARRFGVLTYESMGQRDRALEILRGSPSQVLTELEGAWGTEQLRADPRYEGIAREVRSRQGK